MSMATARPHHAPGITCEVDRHSPEQWSRLVCGFSDATCDQTFALRAERWGHERLSTIVLSRNGEAIAAAILVILTAPVLKRGFAYLKMGPLWRRKGEKADPENLNLILGAISREYVQRRHLLVIALLPPDPDHIAAAAPVLAGQGFRLRRQGMDPNRYLVNARLGEDEQLASLHQKWRYNLRKSLKNNFEITAHESEAAMEEFVALYLAMVTRKSLPTKTPTETLRELIRELPEGMKPQTVLVRHEGRPTAGAIVGNIGETASFIFGATDNRALPLKAGYAMQWWILSRLREQGGVHWYDLGGDGEDPGLRQFKKGLVGKAGHVVETPREYESWRDPVSWLITESITTSRSVSRVLGQFDMDKIRGWLGR